MAAAGPSMELEALITQLMNPNNQARGQAEGIYNTWKQNPDPLLLAEVQLLRSSNKEEVRSMCIVLIRSLITQNASMWDSISQQTKHAVKTEFLLALESEHHPALRHKLCLLVAECGAIFMAKKEWPELLPFLQKCFESGLEAKKEVALAIFGELAFALGSEFQPFYPKLKDFLAAGLCDASLNVRIAALLGTCNFLQSLFKPDARALFLPLAPFVVETIKAILTAKREAEAQSALQLLVQIAEIEPLFLKQCLAPLVDTMLAIARSNSFEQKTRNLGGEVLLTLAESRPAMMRKINFAPAMIELAFSMMFSLDDIPLDEWNLQDEEDEDITDYDYGEEFLDRLAKALGGRAVVPILFSMARTFLANQQHWIQRYAAVMAVSIIGEGAKKFLLPHLKDLVGTIVPVLNDPHPKVRWAACNCLGQMCSDFGPKLQNEFHAQLVPGLVLVMGDSANPRTQAHAAAALINFCYRCDEQVISSYLQPLLDKLYSLLQTGNTIVQKEALTALAAIAQSVGVAFGAYYDALMPNLIQIIIHCKSKDQRSLRCKAIECVSVVGSAVGKEKFNGKELMEILMREQSLVTEPDDPSSSLIHEAMVRICHTMGSDFVPFLSFIIPPLLRAAEHSDIVVTESSEGEPSKDGWEFIVVGPKCVGVRTASLEEKAQACDLLCSYAEELGGNFFSYVDPILKIMLPLLKFYYHEDVRATAAQIMPALLKSASEHLKASGAATGADTMYVRNLFLHIFPTFIEAIEQELVIYVLNDMLEAFMRCLEIVGDNALDKAKLDKCVECLGGTIKDYEEFIESQNEQKQDADIDEEEVERINEEIENYEEALGSVADIIARLIKHHGPLFLSCINPLSETIFEYIKPTSRIAERHVALCIVDDLIEFGGNDATKIFPQVVPIYFSYVKDPDSAIRQATTYGLGIFGEKGREAFAPYVPEALVRLGEACSLPDARSEEFVSATENAISAVGRMTRAYGPVAAGGMGVVDTAQVLPMWLAALPVTEDEEEAKIVYDNLCYFIEQSATHHHVLGPGYEHLPRLISIFARIVGTPLIDQPLSRRILSILQQLQQLPPNILHAAWASLSPDAQSKLQQFSSVR